MAHIINFSSNWNNKLDCHAFTTFRKHQPLKYRVGDTYLITLRNAEVCRAKIVKIKTMKLEEVNDYIAYLDTGYNLYVFKNIIAKMYNGVSPDEYFDFILLKKEKAPDAPEAAPIVVAKTDRHYEQTKMTM